MNQNKILVGLPTYNEAKNIKLLVNRILDLKLPLDILIVDDNSPDGTGDIANTLSQIDKCIKVIHRQGKMGIGAAHLDIIQHAYSHKYDVLITMDTDFAHLPEDIEPFLKKSLEGYDVVIGTRFQNKRSIEDWTLFRKLMTYFSHFLTKSFLRLPYDATGGFRVYQLKNIPQDYFNAMYSTDYEFMFSSLALLYKMGCKIVEIPITLKKRVYGSSKMRLRHAIKGILHLLQLSFTINKTAKKLKESAKFDSVSSADEWDIYWSKEKKKSFYDVIATFYRYKLIKPTLNRFIKVNFTKGAKLLHAGCGSGETDMDVVNYACVTALDLSPKAIHRYKTIHKDNCETIVGSIFEIPVEAASFDGIYNLGVMEHFLEAEIIEILHEFNRVLKPGGKIVLFWPPSYGLSVVALDSIHYIFNNILRKNIKLHPDEPTRVQSKQQIKNFLRKTGFKLEKFSFGIKDAFTYVIVVASKSEKTAHQEKPLMKIS